METLKGLKLDVNRIILELFIPGIFSVLPLFFLFINKFPEARQYFSQSEGMASLTLFILSLTAGLILEDLGSLFEANILDTVNLKKYPNHFKEWEEYLELNIPKESELVAQRYLRTILLRMKFEMSFAFSLIIMIVGLTILQVEIRFCESICSFLMWCVVIPFIITIFLLRESKSSSVLIINTRIKIINSIKK
jgi:hypothetical protein